ncbi:MAG: antibiotic biosynthesis monooxygenase [Planctomycetota bacterium]|nr:antibiotic biosynthesis monooxygenase [Planctomycetota bacterium]GIK52979.1 MAG: antibiotic biosynthesis monooxygenase [Planctomycetota bacterium]
MSDVEQPVTVVVSREVIAGRTSEYEARLKTLLSDAASLPGYLGAVITRPAPGGKAVYTSVFRFASVESLQAFEESDLRRQFLLDVAPLVAAPAHWRRMSGLEFWFTPPAGAVVPQPSRWRMCVVLIAVVYGLVLSIGSGVNWLLAEVPYPLRLLITIGVEVPLMTYLLMPRITRWLARWIYPA